MLNFKFKKSESDLIWLPQKEWKSNLAMVPQRAWVYMVERCSPSEMSLAALTVIYHGAFDFWLMKTIQYDVKELRLRFGMMLTLLTLNCLSKVILMLGMQLCSIMAANAYTPTASEAANLISFMFVSRIPWKWRFWLQFAWNWMEPESSGLFHLRSQFLDREPQTPKGWCFKFLNLCPSMTFGY